MLTETTPEFLPLRETADQRCFELSGIMRVVAHKHLLLFHKS